MWAGRGAERTAHKQTCIHIYMLIYLFTYIHTYIHIYVSLSLSLSLSLSFCPADSRYQTNQYVGLLYKGLLWRLGQSISYSGLSSGLKRESAIPRTTSYNHMGYLHMCRIKEHLTTFVRSAAVGLTV